MKRAFFVFILIFLLWGTTGLAQELRYPPIPGAKTPQEILKGIREGTIPWERALSFYAQYAFRLSLMISGLVALGTIVFGGVKYLLSLGKASAMKDARTWISSGVLGLIIIFSSYLIITTLNPELALLQVPGLEEVELPEIEIPAPPEAELANYFQVPLGKVIEKATVGSTGQAKLNAVKQAALEAESASRKLRDLTSNLKDLTQACECGPSLCGPAPACSVINCQTSCDQQAINQKTQAIKQAILVLKEKQNNLLAARSLLIYDFLELKKAGLLTSLPAGLVDYNTLLGIRFLQEVEISTFPDWEDIEIGMGGQRVADPLTFYFNRLGNEETIALAQSLLAGSGPPPPPDFEPPEPIPDGLAWPVAGSPVITQNYGCLDTDFARDLYYECLLPDGSLGGYHNGLDIRAGFEQEIRAAAQGIVFAAEDLDGCSLGRWVGLEHPDLGLSTVYGHLNRVVVSPGQSVATGQIIGYADSTGISTADHLHFTVFAGMPALRNVCGGVAPHGNDVSPLNYLP